MKTQVKYIPPTDCDIVYKCIKQSNGRLFGGFVRNLVVGNSHCRDLDIWFTCDEDKDKFVELFKQETKFNYPFKLWLGITNFNNEQIKNTISYPFTRSVGQWVTTNCTGDNKANSPVIVDLVVSKSFPVNDFTINMLSYDGELFISHSHQFSVNDIKEQIKSKKGYIYDDYYSKCHTYKSSNACYLRLEKFKKRGYTLIPLSEREGSKGNVETIDYY